MPLFASETFEFKPRTAAKLVPVKLTLNNYSLWNSQLVEHLIRYDALHMVEGTKVSDPKRDDTLKPSMDEQECMDFIKLTLSKAMLPHTIGCSTPRALWLKLEETVRSHVTAPLAELKKARNVKMSTYYKSAKRMADGMEFPISDKEFVKHVLNGLPDEFSNLCTSIRVQYNYNVTPEKLHDLVVAEEAKQLAEANELKELRETWITSVSLSVVAFVTLGILLGKL